MFLKNLPWLCLSASLMVAGCRDDEAPFTPKDFAISGDMAGVVVPTDAGSGGDMSVTMTMYTPTTAHNIDLDPGTGPLKMGTAVSLSRAIVMGRIARHFSKSSMYCEYSVSVVDSVCASPPCGLVLFARGQKLAVMDASTTECPSVSKSGVPFAKFRQGDTIDVTGKVQAFKDTKAPMTVVHHEITCDGATASSGGNAPFPTPVALNDPGLFVVHSGSGWNMYEGTYVTITPTGRKLTVGTVDTFGNFTTVPDNAQWDTNNYFGAADAGQFPMNGSMWTSLSGLVTTDFGGSLSPIQASDYVP
jgi:hypothetical protein